MPISINNLFRHAGLDPASRRSSKDWIPAFAGMTTLIEGAILKQTPLESYKFSTRKSRTEKRGAPCMSILIYLFKIAMICAYPLTEFY